MQYDPCELIEECFLSNTGDGNFAHATADDPYKVLIPENPNGLIIFSRKSHVVLSAVRKAKQASNVGFIGRPALPSRSDVGWIRAAVGDRRLLFLGDLDPPDILTFCWLSKALCPLVVDYIGISDTYLTSCGISCETESDVDDNDPFLIELESSEREALPLLEAVCPTYRDLVGPWCAIRLERGMKMEIEAVANANRNVDGGLLRFEI